MIFSTTSPRVSRLAAASLALFCLACTAPALRAQAAAPFAPLAQWQTYSYPADGFSASFPSAPQLSKNSVPTDSGTFELRAYLGEDSDAAVYVGVCDYGSAVQGRDPQAVLKGAREGAVGNVKAHVLTTSSITLGIYPGTQFEAENDSMHFSARVFLVGTTLYQTLIAWDLQHPYPNTARFMDSFQLIPRTQP
jgi:hypothetical protein